MNEYYKDMYISKFGTRHSKRQKKKAAKQLQKDFHDLDYTYTKQVERVGTKTAENHIFGDLKRAKQILVIPFDTPHKLLWKRTKSYPFDGTASANSNFFGTLIPAVIIYIFTIALMLGLQYVVQDNIIQGISYVVILMIIFYVIKLMWGIANKHNANHYSSAIVTAFTIASKLNDDQKRQTAFVFTDQNNKNRYIGAKVLQKYLYEINRIQVSLIQLTSIGTGEVLAIGYNRNKKLANELRTKEHREISLIHMEGKQILQSYMIELMNSVVIARGDRNDKKMIVNYGIGTSKDIAIEDEKVEAVVELVLKYIKNR